MSIGLLELSELIISSKKKKKTLGKIPPVFM